MKGERQCKNFLLIDRSKGDVFEDNQRTTLRTMKDVFEDHERFIRGQCEMIFEANEGTILSTVRGLVRGRSEDIFEANERMSSRLMRDRL